MTKVRIPPTLRAETGGERQVEAEGGTIGEPLVGRLLLLDALSTEFSEVKIARRDDCPVCGTHPTITEYIDYVEFCAR